MVHQVSLLFCVSMGSDANQSLHHSPHIAAAPNAPQMSDDVPPQPAARSVPRTEFCLPSVKELAKHFAPEDPDRPTDKANKKPTDGARFNGKQVHSLTARSISKEFREGLRNGSYQKAFQRADRTSSGESDQGDGKGNLSPTPSVDLKNMKKFWEEIITANANATKQK